MLYKTKYWFFQSILLLGWATACYKCASLFKTVFSKCNTLKSRNLAWCGTMNIFSAISANQLNNQPIRNWGEINQFDKFARQGYSISNHKSSNNKISFNLCKTSKRNVFMIKTSTTWSTKYWYLGTDRNASHPHFIKNLNTVW